MKVNHFFLLSEYFNFNQPMFYENDIENIPIVQSMLNNFLKIEKEITDYCEHEEMFDYPKFKINKTDYIYENKWEVASLSKLTEDPKRLNMNMIAVEKDNFYEKKQSVNNFLSNNNELKNKTLITKKKCPFVTSLIQELEDKNILQNAYISKLYPKCHIAPHIDRHRDLLRFQLCIQEDENCILTVGKESKAWQKGKFLVFNHCGPYLHQVKHDGKKIRINLSFDLHMEYAMSFINQKVNKER